MLHLLSRVREAAHAPFVRAPIGAKCEWDASQIYGRLCSALCTASIDGITGVSTNSEGDCIGAGEHFVWAAPMLPLHGSVGDCNYIVQTDIFFCGTRDIKGSNSSSISPS